MAAIHFSKHAINDGALEDATSTVTRHSPSINPPLKETSVHLETGEHARGSRDEQKILVHCNIRISSQNFHGGNDIVTDLSQSLEFVSEVAADECDS